MSAIFNFKIFQTKIYSPKENHSKLVHTFEIRVKCVKNDQLKTERRPRYCTYCVQGINGSHNADSGGVLM